MMMPVDVQRYDSHSVVALLECMLCEFVGIVVLSQHVEMMLEIHKVQLGPR